MSLALVLDSYIICPHYLDLPIIILSQHSIISKAKYVTYMATSLGKDSTPPTCCSRAFESGRPSKLRRISFLDCNEHRYKIMNVPKTQTFTRMRNT